MNKLLYILAILFCFTSCKESYKMPNYFKHHENGNVKQITIHTYEVMYGAITPFPGNGVLIWGENSNGTYTYDKNGNVLSDPFYDYQYDDNGKLISAITTLNGSNGIKNMNDFVYNDLDEIQRWTDRTFRYNDNNQICAITEDIAANGFYPASYREYEYNDDGQMKTCNFNHNKSIYGSEYDEKGDLVCHLQMMEHGRVQEYHINITQRDDKGNWIERRITGTNYNGTPVEYIQKREIRYY